MTAPVVPSGHVTPLQLQALRLSANGLTSGQIASRLGASRTAVDLRLNYAARSLGARSRIQAVAVALRLGLIGLDEIRLPDSVAPSRALAGSVAAELPSGVRGEPAVGQRGAGGHGAERAESAGGMRR